MVFTRYPPPPGVGVGGGGPPMAQYQPQHQMPQFHSPPVSLPQPPPLSASVPPHFSNRNSSHGKHNRGSYHNNNRHSRPYQQSQPNLPPLHPPGPEPWHYNPHQPPPFGGSAYPAPLPALGPPLPPQQSSAPYPVAYDIYGQQIPPTLPQPPQPPQPPGPPLPDASYFAQQPYGPPQGFIATPPPGVTGPSIAVPPSYVPSPVSYAPHPTHPLPTPPQGPAPPSGPSHLSPPGPYPPAEYGNSQPTPAPFVPYGPSLSAPPNAPRYPQGGGSGNNNAAWRLNKRGRGISGQFQRGGWTGFGRGKIPRHPGGPSLRGRDASAQPNAPTALGDKAIGGGTTTADSALLAESSEKPQTDEANAPPPKRPASPPRAGGIPPKPPTPLSMTPMPRLAHMHHNKPRGDAAKTEYEQTSSHGSPNGHAGPDTLDASSSQKRSHLTTNDDRESKRSRPSPAHGSPVGRLSLTPGVANRASLLPTSAAGRRPNGDTPPAWPTDKSYDSPSFRPGVLNGLPVWNSRPPSRILSYGSGTEQDANGSASHYEADGGGGPTGLSAPSSLPSRRPLSSRGERSSRSRSPTRRVSHSPRPGPYQNGSRSRSRSRSRRRSRSGSKSKSRGRSRSRSARTRSRSRSRSSSPLDEFELAMLGMVAPDDGDEDNNDDDDSDYEQRKPSSKIKRRQAPKVAAAYSRRW